MNIIDRSEYDKELADWCCSFVDDLGGQRYLLGINKWSESIAVSVNVTGFVDDYTDAKKFKGKPVIRMQDIPDGAKVVSCVHGHPTTARNRLSSLGIDNVDLFQFQRYSGIEFSPVFFWALHEFYDEFELNASKYENVFNKLSDIESQKTFENIINFRLSCNLNYLSLYEDRQKEQYFSSFFSLSEGTVFIDGGAFDGATALVFSEECPLYKKIYSFEPIPENLEILRRNTSQLRDIEVVSKGLYSKCTELQFEGDGISSRLSNSGGTKIGVSTIDSLKLWRMNNSVFIKLDIEGAEEDAIIGAHETILQAHPTLAISVYHKKDDLWVIPELIFNIRSDYTVYLRHYLEGPTETIMYFIPT